MADGSVPIVLSPEPFARTTTYVEAPAGCTVRTMLASAVGRGHLSLDDLARTNVYVDGVRLDRDQALTMVLREGQVVNVVVEPLGGGGGKKDVGQILLSIAVIAVSMWVGGPAGPLQAWPMLARQVAAAAILTAGQMAVAALFKPESNVTKTNDRYALSSASNQYRPWGSMPLALGEVVVAPDLAVKTFTQSLGEDQWIYGILGLHYGPCTADDLKIGDTLVSSMGASDVRVAYHLTPGPRTFSIVANDTDQLDLQEELQATVSGSTPVIRAGSAEGERFEFDFFLPQGLYFAKDDGRKIAASLTVTIRYRPVDQNGVPTGSGAWQVGLTIPLTSSSSDPWRLTRSLSLPLGRYQFEVKRSKLEDDNAKRKTDIGWTAVRAIAFRKPVADETLSLIEFAVRASALNQGSLAPLTCRITPICETWTGTTWGGASPTSNPAAVARWLMTGPAPALPLSSIQADRGLRSWAALCDQYDWKTHLYLTEDRKQDAVLQLLGVNGRASLFWDGTQLVASPWTEKPAPRQLFAGSNLKDHRWEIVFPDPVHALRVEFQNIEQGGEADEVYVYADGYGESADPAKGIEAATLVEALRLEGQQTLERAYREGRWNLAARLHQRRVDSWSTDIEHIVCRYGDRVRLGWDRVGAANATVRNRVWSGGLVSGVRLSQPVRMEPGRSYAMDLRLPDQVLTGVPVINAATTTPVVTRTVHFVDLRNANVSPRGGDLVAFGEPERISEDVEVIGITPGPDLTATLVGVRYVAPLLMAAETGPIPPLQSRLTRERSMDPPMPTLLGWQADAEGVRIGFSMPPWRGSPITGFTLRWRQTPAAGQSSAWVPLPDLPANAMTAVLPPLRELPAEATNRTSAQAQIVAVTADGRASPPLQVTVYEQAIQQPPAGDWSVTPLTDGPDGSRQSGFLVIGLVGSINPRRVTVEYGASANGPWDAAFDGPPVGGVVRAPVLGMQPGAQCWIAITYWTAQAAAPSVRRVLGPFTAPDLIAGDLSPESPVRIAVTEITNRLVSVEQISATNAAAVADLEEVFGDTVSAAASAASAIQQAAIATQAKADAILAAGSAAARASEATQERIDAQTARGQAEGFRNQSAASATTATGAASTATEQAGLAATARGEAQGFAGAALESRNQASGFVTAAEAAAAVSTTQKLEAVAALNAMGRQNIVARENATTPADVFTVTTGGVSGWGFSMVGTGSDAQERQIAVGPLKQNTPYSLSFKARRTSGSGSLPINVDLYPDTLPERTFDIQSNAWTRYTWENFSSDHSDMTMPSVLARFFRPNMEADVNVEITDIKLEEGATATAYTPSPKDAPASAKASAQSASQASASETAAGQQAATATQERIDAQTARGQAEAFKNETASSRDTATAQAALATAQAGLSAGSATLAGQKAGASSDSASLASTKADEAGASAAASRADQISASAARDQALAALMAQGRQNLVARENVASGQLVAVSSGGASGWGFSMVGSGGDVTRTIKVGPLKANTAYSISFKARRTSGSGSLPINVDLYPDTLPERTFDIQSNALTEFKWENIISPSTDMALATVQMRFFRTTLPTGYTYEITDIKLEEGETATAWTPSPKDAAYSASASATSAASAAASDTAAGQSATAASGSATTASTKAGEALTFASQASASAGNANTAAINAGVSATSAASRAGGNIVAMGSFSDGTIGTWTGSVANVAVSGVPDGSTRALRSTGRDAYEGSLISGVWGGRRLRVSGYGVAPGPYPFKIGIHGQTAANGSHWVTTLASPANTTSWATFSGEIVVPADVNRLRPFIQSEGPQGAPDHNVQIATLRIEDVTESASAANSAAVATSQAASASASAADASISANLAASTSAVRGNLLPNGGMERGLEGISGPNLYVSNDSWGPAVRVAPTGNGTYGISWPAVNIFGGATYTVSGDACLFADSGSRYFDMIFLDAGGNIVKDGGEKPMGPGDYSNDRARINDMAWTEQAPSNATQVIVRAIFEGVVNPIAMGARRVKLEFGAGPATAYTADAAVGALSAELNITAGVAADVQSRLASARFEVIAAAGNDPAQLLIRADTSGSLAALVASAIRFSNVVGGQIVEAMKLIGGEVFFMRPIYIDVGSSRLIVGPGGTWVLWFGATSQTAATATRTNGAFCLGTDGKVYYGTGLLASGVTQAKIANFSGNVGRPAPLMVAGQTEAVTVPQNGRFIVEMTNGLTSSFSDSAGGLLRLYVSKDGAETQLGSLNVSAGGGDRYCDLSALNMDIVHNFAGAVKFVVKTNGNGPSTDGQGTVSGTLKATYYPN